MLARACLFGGALLAAGLSAQAQELVFYPNDPAYENDWSRAYSQAAGGAYNFVCCFDEDFNTFSSGVTPTYGTTTVRTIRNGTEIGVEAVWNGEGQSEFGSGFAVIRQFFGVTENCRVRVDWSFAGADTSASGGVVYDARTRVNLVRLNPNRGDQPVGSATFDLVAGRLYSMMFGIQQFHATDRQHMTLAIVTPCGADRDGDGDGDVSDLLAYLGAYRSGDADMNGDGQTDVGDLLGYLGQYRAGC